MSLETVGPDLSSPQIRSRPTNSGLLADVQQAVLVVLRDISLRFGEVARVYGMG